LIAHGKSYTLFTVYKPEVPYAEKYQLSADGTLIEQARQRAAAENSTLNAEFRLWLEKYAHRSQNSEAFLQLMSRLEYVEAGGSFSRLDLIER